MAVVRGCDEGRASVAEKRMKSSALERERQRRAKCKLNYYDKRMNRKRNGEISLYSG